MHLGSLQVLNLMLFHYIIKLNFSEEMYHFIVNGYMAFHVDVVAPGGQPEYCT